MTIYSMRLNLAVAMLAIVIQGCASSPQFSAQEVGAELMRKQASAIRASVLGDGLETEVTVPAVHHWYSLSSSYDQFGKSFEAHKNYCSLIGYRFERVDYSRSESVQYGCMTGATIAESQNIAFVLWAAPRISDGRRSYHYFVSFSNPGVRARRFYQHALWYSRFHREQTDRARYEMTEPRPWIPSSLIDPSEN